MRLMEKNIETCEPLTVWEPRYICLCLVNSVDFSARGREKGKREYFNSLLKLWEQDFLFLHLRFGIVCS